MICFVAALAALLPAAASLPDFRPTRECDCDGAVVLERQRLQAEHTRSVQALERTYEARIAQLETLVVALGERTNGATRRVGELARALAAGEPIGNSAPQLPRMSWAPAMLGGSASANSLLLRGDLDIGLVGAKHGEAPTLLERASRIESKGLHHAGFRGSSLTPHATRFGDRKTAAGPQTTPSRTLLQADPQCSITELLAVQADPVSAVTAMLTTNVGCAMCLVPCGSAADALDCAMGLGP
jgi:hypothetical protein